MRDAGLGTSCGFLQQGRLAGGSGLHGVQWRVCSSRFVGRAALHRQCHHPFRSQHLAGQYHKPACRPLPPPSPQIILFTDKEEPPAVYRALRCGTAVHWDSLNSAVGSRAEGHSVGRACTEPMCPAPVCTAHVPPAAPSTVYRTRVPPRTAAQTSARTRWTLRWPPPPTRPSWISSKCRRWGAAAAWVAPACRGWVVGFVGGWRGLAPAGMPRLRCLVPDPRAAWGPPRRCA